MARESDKAKRDIRLELNFALHHVLYVNGFFSAKKVAKRFIDDFDADDGSAAPDVLDSLVLHLSDHGGVRNDPKDPNHFKVTFHSGANFGEHHPTTQKALGVLMAKLVEEHPEFRNLRLSFRFRPFPFIDSDFERSEKIPFVPWKALEERLKRPAPAEAMKEATKAAVRRLELSSDVSQKFWEGWTVGSTLCVRFGKLGSEGQRKDKAFPSEAAATQALEALVREKLGKGYEDTKPGTASKRAREAKTRKATT